MVFLPFISKSTHASHRSPLRSTSLYHDCSVMVFVATSSIYAPLGTRSSSSVIVPEVSVRIVLLAFALLVASTVSVPEFMTSISGISTQSRVIVIVPSATILS